MCSFSRWWRNAWRLEQRKYFISLQICLPLQSLKRWFSLLSKSWVSILGISLAFRYIDSSHSSRSFLLQFPYVPHWGGCLGWEGAGFVNTSLDVAIFLAAFHGEGMSFARGEKYAESTCSQYFTKTTPHSNSYSTSPVTEYHVYMHLPYVSRYQLHTPNRERSALCWVRQKLGGLKTVVCPCSKAQSKTE